MTALFPRRTKPTEVNPKRVKRLGSVGGTTYYEIDGDEYVPMGWAATVDDARDGELLVKVDERVFDERGQSMVVGSKYRRLLKVNPDTFAAERSKRTRRADTAPRKLADVLSPLTALRGVQPLVLASSAVAGAAPAQSLKGTGTYAEGKPAPRGRAVLDFLERQGVTLQVHAGKLLVTDARNNLRNDLRDVIERAEPLLVGWLTEKPAACQLTHSKGAAPEAWTVLVGGLLACESHANGELKP
jgi:hypothetical protein